MSRRRCGFDESMQVRRVSTATGSRIEPSLDRRWSELDQLRWYAAVVTNETGLAVTVKPSNYSIDGRSQRGYFDIGWPDGVFGAFRIDSAWRVLTGISIGAGAVRRLSQVGA